MMLFIKMHLSFEYMRRDVISRMNPNHTSTVIIFRKTAKKT